MVKVAWKVIKGNGPYAYLQKSVKKPNGSVTSQHLAYLGGIGKKGMFPGKFFNVPPTDDGEFHGGRVLINPVPDELKAQLKPAALEALESIEAQVQSGVSTKDIVVPQKDKLGATPKPTPASPAPPASPGELGATDLPAEAPAKTQPQKGKLGATPKPPPASPPSPPAGPGKSGATQTTQSVPDASPAPASLPALPSLAALLPGYVSPSKKVEHYEQLEQATAASMAESGLPHGIRAAQLHAKALQEQLSPAHRSAVNRARSRLTSLMLSAWIGSTGDPKGVAPDVATQSSRRLASAAARGGIATLEQEAARLKAQNADPARAEYIGSIVSLVKTHLPTELDAGVIAKPAPAPSPAPVSAEPTTTQPGPVSSKPAKSAPPPKLSDLVPGYSTPKVSHQSHGELELVAAEAIKSTEDIRDGIRAARRYAEILKQELPAHEHTGVDTAVNWLTADILHAAAKYTFGAPGWFPDGMGASDLYDLAQAAGHGGLSGLEQKAQELSTSAAKATGVQAAVNAIKNFMPLDSRDPDATPPTPPSPGRRSVEVPAPAPAVAGDPPLSPPKISAVPKDTKGKALIHPANVKKLEQVAAHGDVATLEELGQQLAGKMLAPAKKSAIAEAVADLKSQLTASVTPAASVDAPPVASGSGPVPSGSATGAADLSELVPGFQSMSSQHSKYAALEQLTAEMIQQGGIPAGIEAVRSRVAQLKKETSTFEHAELDNIARWTTASILAAAMGSPLTPGQAVSADGNVVHLLAATAGLRGSSGMHQLAAGLSNTIPHYENIVTLAGQMEGFLPADPPLPKLSAAPKGAQGKPLLTEDEVQALEQAFILGNYTHLTETSWKMKEGNVSTQKKTAINHAVEDLFFQALVQKNAPTDSRSGAPLAAAPAIEPGQTDSPTADEPAKAVDVTELHGILKSLASLKSQQPLTVVGQQVAGQQKDWDSDLLQISGPQGSNQGGLFRDKELGTKHYVKWSGSDVRSRVETLAGLLYNHAGVPVPQLRTIDYQGQTAVMSDWIEGSKSMTASEMTKHPDVRANFAVDAWLGNWDVVGLGFDNIVQDAAGKAYRIDLGGSLLFRAQGQPKPFPPHVEELDTLLKPSVNKSSARVFKGITHQELLAGAQKVANVSDEQIDAAVDQMQLPKKSPDYADSDDLPTTLKYRLKKRRDHVVQQIQQKVALSAPAEAPISPPVETSPAPAAPLSSTTSDPAPAKPATGPKILDIPSNYAGNPLIAASNVAKLEKAAATGSVDALDQAAAAIKSKKIGYLKKAAINKAVQDIKEQMAEQHGREPVSDTGMSAAVEAVNDGDVKLPSRPVPAPEVVQRHVDLQEKGKKDWEADLIQVDGKKGSTQGALFKDQHLNTVHYVKWSDSDLRPRVEALTGALYTLADVPVPIQRVIDFKGQTAVMSDWLDDASPMTVAQLKRHPDVRRNFVVDAWLANWDVVGTNGVNIVKGPGDKAYRVDLGGSLLFRAMGGGKSLSPEVGELTSMLDSGQNAVAAQVFAGVTDAELQSGAEKVGKISDQQIDDAVDQLGIPKTSPEYPVSSFGETAKDLPELLKSRLKQRRDYVAKEVLNIIDLKQKKAQEAEKQLAQLEETSDLKPETLATVLEHAPKLKLNMGKQHRRDIQDQVLAAELGKTKGKKASGSVSSTFNGWKGSANSPSGRLMRWATGAIDGTGDRELRRLQKFNEFLVSKKMLNHHTSAKEIDEVNDAAASSRGENLAEGLQVTRKANRIARVLQNPGETHVTIYRGWKPEQVEYLKLQTAQVGDKVELEDPPVYSWSFDLQTAKSFGSGSLVTKAEVPIDKLILTDRLNNTGNHSGENEVLFKGVEKQKMEVLYKY